MYPTKNFAICAITPIPTDMQPNHNNVLKKSEVVQLVFVEMSKISPMTSAIVSSGVNLAINASFFEHFFSGVSLIRGNGKFLVLNMVQINVEYFNKV